MYGNPEVDRILSGLKQQLDRYADTREQLAALSGSTTSPDGFITVTVGPTGHLTNLELNPRAMRMDSQTLAETIMATVRQAQAEIGERVSEIMAPMTDSAREFSQLATGQQGLPGVDRDMLPTGIDTSRDPIEQVRAQIDRLTRGR